MTTITRRAALAGIASIPATTAPGRASAPPDAPAVKAELPSERCARLGNELADALNDFADGRFHADVHPSAGERWPVCFSRTARGDRVSPELAKLLAANEAAYADHKAAQEECIRIDKLACRPVDVRPAADPEAWAAWNRRYAALGGPEADRRDDATFELWTQTERAVYEAPVLTLADARAKARLALKFETDLGEYEHWVVHLVRTLAGTDAAA